MTGDAVAPAMPERIGRFELLLPVGTGGMGTVYLARAEAAFGVSQNYAVKLMHAELRANPETAKLLMEEARLAARIRHPNVVSVLEAGDSPHGVYLVMHHIEGDSLAGLIGAARKAGERLPLRVCGKILHDALTGLHAAHELRDDDGRALELVHRDFSPHNILVGVDGISLLADFGIAKALSNTTTTATGTVKGKVGYLSPEQACGERLDRRCDVWAAGVVAWEMITAERLFRESSDAATLVKIVTGDVPPRASSRRGDVPPLLDQAIAAALEPDSGRRLSSALVLRDRVDEAFGALGGVASEEEVADTLQELLGHRLSQRRERVRRVMRQRAEEAVAAATAATGPALMSPASRPAAGGASGRRKMLTALAALGALAGAVALGASLWPAPAPAAASAVGAAEVDVEPAVAPAAEQHPAVVASAAAESTAEAPTRRLTIYANEPVAQVRIDGKTTLLPNAVKRFDIPLAQRADSVVAMTRDGRTREVTLRDGQSRVDIVFAPPRRRARPAVVRPTPAPNADGLAASPYGAQ